jgi:hypothetical protein
VATEVHRSRTPGRGPTNDGSPWDVLDDQRLLAKAKEQFGRKTYYIRGRVNPPRFEANTHATTLRGAGSKATTADDW